ncbi:MAG: hypothetical protein GY754_44105 [bacterium]|nr:hypothetical protein [bacterium]
MNSISDADRDLFKKICTQVTVNVPPVYRWQWDRRLGVGFIAFAKEDLEVIFSAVTKAFDMKWDSSNYNTSAFMPKLVDHLAGMSDLQLVFTSEGLEDAVVYAAWWPWGDGSNISLRVGLFRTGNEPVGNEEAKAFLEDWLKF